MSRTSGPCLEDAVEALIASFRSYVELGWTISVWDDYQKSLRLLVKGTPTKAQLEAIVPALEFFLELNAMDYQLRLNHRTKRLREAAKRAGIPVKGFWKPS